MKTPRKLWISDIHGRYQHLIKLLREADYLPGHDFLIVGGDMIDRGPNSGAVLRQIKSLEDRFPNHVKVLVGNHEDMMGMTFAGNKEAEGVWLNNGGIEALKSFHQDFTSEEEMDEHLAWAITRPTHYEDEEYFYVHAGVDPHYDVSDNQRDDFLWIREPFLSVDTEYILRVTGGKIVVHGHTPADWVANDGARINCDLGAGSRYGKLALVDLTNQIYYASKIQNGSLKVMKIRQEQNEEVI